MFTSGLYTVIASATAEYQSDIIFIPASRQVAAALRIAVAVFKPNGEGRLQLQKLELFVYRSTHELITTTI